MNAEYVVKLLIGLAILGIVTGIFWWNERAKQAEDRHKLDEAQRRAEVERKQKEKADREKVKARKGTIATFLAFVQDSANNDLLLTNTWRNQFDWSAVVEAARVESIDLSSVLMRSVFTAFQAAHQTDRVTPEACEVMSRQLETVAEAGHSARLEKIVKWLAVRRPQIIEQAVGNLRAEIEACERTLDEISEDFWESERVNTTAANTAGSKRDQRDRARMALQVLELIRSEQT